MLCKEDPPHLAFLFKAQASSISQITPGIPDAFRHCASVTVAHLEPVLLEVTGSGSLPSVVLSLPREADAAFERCQAEAFAEAGLSTEAAPSNLPVISRCAAFQDR